MGIKNKFLITGMVATALTIEFLEWGTVQLSGPFLYGDENGVSLILKKDDDTFVIQPGEKIIINDENSDPIDLTGFSGMEARCRGASFEAKVAPDLVDPGFDARVHGNRSAPFTTGFSGPFRGGVQAHL